VRGIRSLRDAENGVELVPGVRLAESGCEAFIQARIEALDRSDDGDARDVFVFELRDAYCWLRLLPVVSESI
jgi:hypothetical protein